ncbi:MAG: alpha-L-fucosidase [Clostridia bacterium]|nr:alpha-L-fucosidase [Clostridia bacterium]
MHIDDWDPEFLSKFSPEAYVENLKLAKINSAMLYFQSHVGLCYWPTSSGKMHAGFVGREDAMRKTVELCHQNGIAVTAYYSLIYDTYQNDLHPDWSIVNPDGKPGRDATNLECAGGGSSRYGHVCPNNPDYRKYTETQIKEISAYFPKFECMFFDMLFWPRLCYCKHCRARYLAEVGAEIPTVRDDRDPAWRTHMRKRREWMGEYAQWATATAKKYMPHLTVYHNASQSVVRNDTACAEEVVAACDYIAGDLYSNNVFARLYLKNATPNQPFEYMFSRCHPNLASHTQIKSLDVMRSEIMRTVAHHGASFVIDAIDPVGTMDRRVYERLGTVFGEMEGYEKYYYGEPVEDVGVYYSLKGKVALFGDKWSNYQGASTAINTLIEANIPAAVTGGYADIQKHRALIVSATTSDDEYDTERLVKYVQEGGSLYFSGAEHAGLLKAFFGAENTGYTEEQIVYLAPEPAAKGVFDYYTADFPLRFECCAPQVVGIPEEKVLATLTLPYTKRHLEVKFASIHSDPPGIKTDIPTMAYTAFGKGKVVWSAVPLECYTFYDYRNILVNILDTHLGLTRSVVSDAPVDVELTLFKTEDEVLLSAVLHNEAYRARKVEDFTVSLSTDFVPSRVLRLPDMTPVAAKIEGNSVTFTVEKLDMLAMYSIR